jgi:tagaturonate reductase
VRVLPSLLEYQNRKGTLPQTLTFSLAALLAFYRGTEIVDGALQGSRDGQSYAIKDDKPILEEFAAAWTAYDQNSDVPALVTRILGQSTWWKENLTMVPGLVDAVAGYLQAILSNGMVATMEDIVAEMVA